MTRESETPPTVWRYDVPPASGTFMGKDVRVEIDFAETCAAQPSEHAKALVDEVLADLPAILRRAWKALAEYERTAERDYASHISNPHIWIYEGADNGPKAWTFVVERDDWPGFGWHIEFNGSELVEIWAGD